MELWEKLLDNKEYGFAALVALMALWYMARQNTQVVARLERLEDWSRDTFSKLLIKNQEIIQDNSRAMRESSHTHREILKALSHRPCLMDDNHHHDYRPHPSRVTDIPVPAEPSTTQRSSS